MVKSIYVSKVLLALGWLDQCVCFKSPGLYGDCLGRNPANIKELWTSSGSIINKQNVQKNKEWSESI